jgi:uncharacterized protein (PEP-CTERM system associated)
VHGIGLSTCALAALLAFDARAQWSEFGSIAGGLSNAGSRAAPTSSGGRSFSITPFVTLSETLTDNANLTPEGEWDAITEATVGLTLGGTYGSLNGSLSVGLTGLYYARGTGENRIENTNTLNAAGTLAVVEDRVFVDGYARVSQQLIDPFGVRPSDPARPTDNTTTTLDYGLSPWAQGTIGGSVDYFARLNFTGSANAESSAYGFQDFSGLARLEGGTRFSRLGWALTAAGRASAYGDEVRTGNYGGTASLIYAVTPYFNVRANAGVEFQNYLDADVTQRSELYGAGFDWQPTDRTSITGFYEKRFFGDSYFASVQHRTAKTVWTYRGRQGVDEIGGVTPVSLGTNYDLFFQQFASIEPDPVKRDQLVREFLRRNGIPLDRQVVAGFLTTQIQLVRSHDFSFAWLIGRRNSLTLSVGQSDTSALVDFLGAGDAFDNESFVREQRVSASFSHQLTPRSSISVFGGRTNTDDRDGTRSTTQDTFFVNWGTTTGSRSRFDVTGRRTVFDSATRPYTENALIATFYMSF